MYKKPVFWISFVLISIICAIFAYKYFPDAYPLVSLDLKMDRRSALDTASDLALEYQWGPDGFSQAASFRVDEQVQNFVELEAGGTEAFRQMLAGKLYSPYTWRVRHFKEGEANETLIRFTPDGKPYGFREKLPEDEPGASLNSDSALAIAEKSAEEEWGIVLSDYELVERSQEIRPGGRTDHTFTYERPDVRIGEGLYRLRLVVAGDRLTELTHFIKIPEAFSRRYTEMRSANETIASTAIIAMVVLYIVGGCIIGLFFLLRQHWIAWRKPLIWGLFIALLQVLAIINHWPLAWMSYDTALSSQGFLLRQITRMLLTFAGLSAFLTLIFAAAEGLTRRAFPGHIQMWRLWSSDVAGSRPVLGRTAGGYLLVGIFFAFDVGLYFFASRVLGWWTPSGALFEPDVLATYFPWLTSIAISLQAGFLEECLFRAIPIAGAVLLGQRFGYRRFFIVGAFLVQALVFGAGHANYPQQPAYARVAELLIPSLAFGLIYLRFGLLPAIVLHFAVDVVWFALPLFVSSASGNWINQVMVIILVTVPLWVVIRARIRSRRWRELNEDHLNGSWRPLPREKAEPEIPEHREAPEMNVRTKRLLLAGGILGLILWIAFTDFHNYAPSLTTGRQKAEKIARQTLAERRIELSDSWKTLSRVETPMGLADRFVWQTGKREDYEALIGEYLPPPYWGVRFARFEGDVAERAEEYEVFVSKAGDLFRFLHVLPEARPGASLTESEARNLADSAVRASYGLDPSILKDISIVPSKLPERTDWLLTFADTAGYPLEEGEARLAVQIGGDEVVDAVRYIHVPEQWARKERDRKNMTGIVGSISVLAVFVFALAGVAAAITRWSRGKFAKRVFIVFFALLFGLGVVATINAWPGTVAQFSTAKPFSDQALAGIARPLLLFLLMSAGLALIIGLVHSWKTGRSGFRESENMLSGFSLGALVSGLSAVIAILAETSLEPYWADYDALSSYIPILDIGLSTVLAYVVATAFCFLIVATLDLFTCNWTRRRSLISILFVLLVLIGSGVDVSSFREWLLSGLLTGIVCLLAYVHVLRFSWAMVPPAVASGLILHTLKEGLLWAHPAALSGAAVGIILIGLLSVYWHRILLTRE